VVWQEVGTEFDGEDPVDPTLRAKAAETRESLQALALRLGRKARLPEPDEAALDRCREMAEQALTSLQVLDR